MKKFLFAVLMFTTATRGFAQQAVIVSANDSVKGSLTKSGAVSASYAAGRLSMTPTTTKQTQGKTFGEKVAGGLQAGAPVMAPAVSSVSGVSKPGGAVSASYAAGRLSIPPATPKQTQGASFGEQVAKGMAAPGQPVGGIVVKGGKNAGGSFLIAITNEKGVFELYNLQPGDYQFILTTPDAPQGKSISEKGVKRSASEMAAPGTPIGGIVVKGGKNPGGSMTNLSVSQEGEIRFEILEAGNYQFMIQAGEAPYPNNSGQQNEKVVEKATSGLKDTLKTNV
ncbi:MAG: hypothetical protein J7599_23625 [Niabella sp.]|nr:hypothetical protein [Niabella sp.]